MTKLVLEFEPKAFKDKPFIDQPAYAPEFYTAIGRVVISWGMFERNLEGLLSAALRVAAHDGITQAPMTSFKRRVKQIDELYAVCPQLNPNYSALKAVIPEAKVCAGNRNAIIHSTFHGFIDANEAPVMVLYNKKKRGFYDLNIKMIDNVSDEINDISGKLFEFRLNLILLLSVMKTKEKGLLRDQ